MTLGTSLRTLAGRAPLVAALLCAMWLAAACGGGDTVEEFQPERLVVFGDEASVLTDAEGGLPRGRKYSINAVDVAASGSTPGEDLDPPGPGNCEDNRLWIQILADDFDFGFDQCKPKSGDSPQRARTLAAPGAKVSDIARQIDSYLLTDSFSPTDLVAIYAGANDIVEIYGTVTELSQCEYDAADPNASGTAARAARERGEALADQVNRVADGGSGGRVLFVTVPDQGATPFARKDAAARPDFDRRDCLTDLTDAFNGGLRTNVLQDGRYVGLVLLDDQVKVILENADSFDYDNVSVGACLATAQLPNCTTDTLLEDAESNRYLWADDRQFGNDIQNLLGRLALNRLSDVPF